MPPARASVLQVFVFRNGEFLGTDVFNQSEIVIGRDADEADLVLSSEQVSRAHAVAQLREGVVRLRDSGSTNGIYVNGEQVDESEIGAFDEVDIGDFSLKFKVVGKKRPKATFGDEPTRSLQIKPKSLEAAGTSVDLELPSATKGGGKTTGKAGAKSKSRAKKSGAKSRAEERQIEKAPREEATTDDATVAEPALSRPHSAPGADGLKERAAPAVALSGWLRRGTQRLQGWAEARKKGQSAAVSAAKASKPAPAPTPSEPEPPFAGPHVDDEVAAGPAFALVERLAAQDSEVLGSGDKKWLEVMAYADDEVHDIQLLPPRRPYHIGPRLGLWGKQRRDLPRRIRLAVLKGNGSALIEVRRESKVVLERDGKSIPFDTSAAKAIPRRQTLQTVLQPGTVMRVDDGARHYRLRFVTPPVIVQENIPFKEKIKPTPLTTRAYGGAVIGHLLVLLIVGLVSPNAAPMQPTGPAKDEFVELIIDQDMMLEEAPPEPEPEPEQPVTAPKPTPAPRQRSRGKRNVKPKAGGTSKGPSGVLGLLSKRGSSRAPGPAAAVAAASNISATKVPGGSGGFRLSGLQGKPASSSLSLGGGGGGVSTKGGTALLRGGGGGGGRVVGRGGTGRVRAVVGRAVTKRIRATGQGSLDRAEIQKVINKNIGAIQRCYERELLQNPGLAGKLHVEWVIGTSGSVTSVRQKFNSVGSTAVSSCILGQIKGWRFPRPRGGVVTVAYPFNFRATGF